MERPLPVTRFPMELSQVSWGSSESPSHQLKLFEKGNIASARTDGKVR